MTSVDSTAALGSLEFAAVLEVIAGRTAGPLAASRIRELLPDTDPSRINLELARVGELLSLHRRGERLEVPAVPDLRSALGRLRVDGSVLELGELADTRRTMVSGRLIAEELQRIATAAPLVADACLEQAYVTMAATSSPRAMRRNSDVGRTP